MPLLLTNDDVERVLTMRDCVDAIEEAYGELSAGRAIYNNRRDTLMPTSDSESFFRLKNLQRGNYQARNIRAKSFAGLDGIPGDRWSVAGSQKGEGHC